MYILYFIGFNFIIYSFLGWVIEELYCFIVNKTFKCNIYNLIGFLFLYIKYSIIDINDISKIMAINENIGK